MEIKSFHPISYLYSIILYHRKSFLMSPRISFLGCNFPCVSSYLLTTMSRPQDINSFIWTPSFSDMVRILSMSSLFKEVQILSLFESFLEDSPSGTDGSLLVEGNGTCSSFEVVSIGFFTEIKPSNRSPIAVAFIPFLIVCNA